MDAYYAARNAASGSGRHPAPGAAGYSVPRYPTAPLDRDPPLPSSSSSSSSGNTPSLAVRLLQIAGEYENSQKRERDQAEERITTLRARNQELEAGNTILREDLGTANRQVARLEGELSVAGAKGEERMAYLEAELLAARFELADRSAALAALHASLASVAGTLLLGGGEGNQENSHPTSGAAAGPVQPPKALTNAPKGSSATNLSLVASANQALVALLPSKDAARASAAAAREAGRWSAAALVEAAERGDEATLDKILTPGADLYQQQQQQQQQQAGQRGVGMMVVPSGGGPALQKALGCALRAATWRGHTGIVQRLLGKGALGGGRGEVGGGEEDAPHTPHRHLLWTLLHLACAGGHEGVLRIFLNKDPNPAAPAPPPGSPSLAPALASAGITLGCRDTWGRTPLHLAAAGGHGSCCKLLLMAAADPYLRDAQGLTPGDYASGTEAFLARAEKAVAGATAAVSVAAGGPGGKKPVAPPFLTALATAKAHLEGLRAALGVTAPSPAQPAAAAAAAASGGGSGKLPSNPPSHSATSVLSDTALLFWNASLRANLSYAAKRFDKAIDAYSVALDLCSKCPHPVSPRDMATLHYNRARARYRMGGHCAAVEDCGTALRWDTTYRNALAQRAECYMSLFDFERAVRDFQALIDSDRNDVQWGRRLVEARAQRDMSHYGTLGLAREAEGGAIKKAYRAMCLKWHPDKHSGSGMGPGGASEQSMRANAAFKRITDAYECLSDAYKRAIYDMDPRSSIGTGSAEGFDKWQHRESERSEERESERVAALERDEMATRLEDEAIKRAKERAREERAARAAERAAATATAAAATAAAAAHAMAAATAAAATAAASAPLPSSAASPTKASIAATTSSAPAAAPAAAAATAAAAAPAPSAPPLTATLPKTAQQQQGRSVSRSQAGNAPASSTSSTPATAPASAPSAATSTAAASTAAAGGPFRPSPMNSTPAAAVAAMAASASATSRGVGPPNSGATAAPAPAPAPKAAPTPAAPPSPSSPAPVASLPSSPHILPPSHLPGFIEESVRVASTINAGESVFGGGGGGGRRGASPGGGSGGE